MDALICLNIWSKGKNSGAAAGVELEHFNGVAKIEVEDFVGVEAVHLGEGSGLQEIVNGGGGGAGAAGQFEGGGGGVSAAEEAALDRMRLKIQQGLDFAGGHGHRCYQGEDGRMGA